MLDRVSAREMSEWMAYYQLEPWGEERADWRSALQTAILGNVVIGIVGGKRTLDVEKCKLNFGPKKRMTGEQMAQVFKMFANAHNRRLKNG